MFVFCQLTFMVSLPFLLLNSVSQTSSLNVCNSALGLEDGRIKDSQLSASSYYSNMYIYSEEIYLNTLARFGRLKNKYAWCGRGLAPYFQIDFGEMVYVTGLATQGFRANWNNNYVKTYTLKYSVNGSAWYNYSSPNKKWKGNKDGNTIQKNILKPFQTRYLRIYPLTYSSRKCLRVEVYGCRLSGKATTQSPTQATAPTSSLSSAAEVIATATAPMATAVVTTTTLPTSKSVAKSTTLVTTQSSSIPSTVNPDSQGNWVPDGKFTPGFHIAADGHGDLGSRFVDLNGDGRMDQVYHRWVNVNIQQKGAYLSVPNYGFVCAPQYTPPFHIAADGYGDLGARFVDLNGDGKIDMVYHRWINDEVQEKGAYLNNGNGWTYSSHYTPPFHIAADGHSDLGARFIELNGDGKIDMVYHRWINDKVQQKGAYLNNGNGWTWAKDFTPPFHIAADGYNDVGARFVDLNGDGRADMVYHRWINGKVQQKGAYLNNGYKWVWAPQYTPPFHIAADEQGDLGARFVDLNGDGKIDMVYHRWINSNSIQKGAYINSGNGWSEASVYTPPFHIAADGYKDLGARFADVNGDGLVDFVYHRWVNGNTQQKGAYINTGCGWKFDAAFTPPFHIAADGYGDLGARLVDLNGDGATDLAYHRWINSKVQQKMAYLACGNAFDPYCLARSRFCSTSPVVQGICRKTCNSCPK